MNFDPSNESEKKRASSGEATEATGVDEMHARLQIALNDLQLNQDASTEYEDDVEDDYEEEEELNLGQAPEEQFEDDFIEEETEEELQVWRPGIDNLEEGEVLEYDPTAYELIYFINVDAPCLSFNMLADNLGTQRQSYPQTAYIVAGSQAPQGGHNNIKVMKMSNMYKTKFDGHEDDPTLDDEEGEYDGEFDEEAHLETQSIYHQGIVNRIRAMPQRTNIVASMSDTSKVHIFDLANHFNALDSPTETQLQTPEALFSFTGHTAEGFALNWSSLQVGRLASADRNGGLHVWDMNNSTTWNVSDVLKGHQGSVEDIQWSTTESDVLATTGVDRTLQIWDVRDHSPELTLPDIHTSDVNVIHWSNLSKTFIASGGDDGIFKIWDIRNPAMPMLTFDWHQKPITSIEWSPNDPDVLAVASEDNSATIWDLSLNKDPNEQNDFPAELLFVHQGQKELKEVHWHPQIPDLLISTAADGFNIWMPSSADE